MKGVCILVVVCRLLELLLSGGSAEGLNTASIGCLKDPQEQDVNL